MAYLNFYPPIIAHRGASSYAPENTILAFTKAVQLGVKWIEFDVMLAACGEPIIFHDETLDRTTNGKGQVDQFPYSYLRNLDAGSWFNPAFSEERIPTLAQVVEFLERTKINANVELKPLPGQEEKLVKRVLKEITPYLKAAHSHILFSSFSIEALRLLRRYSADCCIGILLHEWEADWEKLCESLNCVSLDVNHDIITPASAKKIKQMDKSLLCYTVNNPARALELYSWGVDAVFSDAPEKILLALRNGG